MRLLFFLCYQIKAEFYLNFLQLSLPELITHTNVMLILQELIVINIPFSSGLRQPVGQYALEIRGVGVFYSFE